MKCNYEDITSRIGVPIRVVEFWRKNRRVCLDWVRVGSLEVDCVPFWEEPK